VTRRRIDAFFRELDRELRQKADVILVGASAGALMGHIRPSVDIDFEIRLSNDHHLYPPADLEAVIKKVSYKIGVAVNFSENISRWSMISFLDYRATAVFYKRFGQLKVKLIAPEYWTIGKMARFLELDIQDMIKIIHKKKLKSGRLLSVWKAALEDSDLCLELGQFRDHVSFFMKKYGKKLWGKAFDEKKSLENFSRAL
jgi:hypothetical protein